VLPWKVNELGDRSKIFDGAFYVTLDFEGVIGDLCGNYAKHLGFATLRG
jgi:hypothetical protein